MTALMAIIAPFWGQILGVLGVAGGFLVAWASRKSAATKVAQAGQQVAEKDTKLAKLSQANAEANAKAADSIAQAAQERTNVENDVSTLPAGAAADELHRNWTKPGP